MEKQLHYRQLIPVMLCFFAMGFVDLAASRRTMSKKIWD